MPKPAMVILGCTVKNVAVLSLRGECTSVERDGKLYA